MMHRLAALVLLTWRASLRSRVVGALVALLLAALLGLPALIRGDGSADGVVRLTLGYTLGAAFGILALASLWLACAVVSSEVESSVLQLTWVKPVRGIELWLGKWLGLLLLDALLLTGIGVVTYAVVAARLDRSDPAAASLLQSRDAYRPDLPPVAEQAEQLLEQLDQVPSGLSRRALLRQIRRDVTYQADSIGRGGEASWLFRLDRAVQPDRPLWLRLRFEADYSSRTVIKAVCRLHDPQSGRTVTLPIDDLSTREIEIEVPSAELAGSREIELTLQHAGAPDAGSLLIQPRQGIALLVPAGTLAGNLTAALTLQLALLALLAALGLTMGTLFSLPVAAFAATGLLLATLVSSFVLIDPWAEDEEHPSLWTGSAYVVAESLARLAAPALEPRPLGQLTAAEAVPAVDVGRAWLWNGLLMPAVLAAVAAAALRSRELAR